MTSADRPPKLAVADTAPQRPADQRPMQRDIRERIVRLNLSNELEVCGVGV